MNPHSIFFVPEEYTIYEYSYILAGWQEEFREERRFALLQHLPESIALTTADSGKVAQVKGTYFMIFWDQIPPDQLNGTT